MHFSVSLRGESVRDHLLDGEFARFDGVHGDLQPLGVAIHSSDKYFRRTGGFRCEGTGEPLLARPLDEHAGFGRQAVTDFGYEYVRHEEKIIREAAVQMRRVGASGLAAVAAAPFAEARGTPPAVNATAAALAAFHEDAVAF